MPEKKETLTVEYSFRKKRNEDIIQIDVWNSGINIKDEDQVKRLHSLMKIMSAHMLAIGSNVDPENVLF